MNREFIVKFYMVNGDQFTFKYQAVNLGKITDFINKGLNANFIADGECKIFINTKNINGFEIIEEEEVTA